MNEYLRWCLWQYYLLVCRPSQFGQEFKEISREPRLTNRFLLKWLPAMAVLPGLCSLIAGVGRLASGERYNWEEAGGFVLWSVFLGFAFAAIWAKWFGTASGVSFGVAGGMALGLVLGVAPGVAFDDLPGQEAAAAYGLVYGLALGLSLGVGLAVARGGRGYRARGLVRAVALSGALAMFLGVVAGVASGTVASFSTSFAENLPIDSAADEAFCDVALRKFDLPLAASVGASFGVGLIIGMLSLYLRFASYPFDVVLTTVIYIAIRRRPDAIGRLWKWCPVAWNEVIWLPLPFVGKLLETLVTQDRGEGFRQITFVAAERKHQHGAVQDALENMALGSLQAKSIRELADVPQRLDWTSNFTIHLPVELAEALPVFMSTAQHVGQYLASQTHFRQGEALTEALRFINILRYVLNKRRGRLVSRLIQVANLWRALLDDEEATYLAQTETASEIPNLFVFGKPVTDQQGEVFGGRQDIGRQVEASLLGARHAPTLLLHGPRRMGKSSILHQLPRLLGLHFAPAIIDCQNPAVIGNAGTLLSYLSRAAATALQRQRVSIDPLRRDSLGQEPFAVFDDWLDAAERKMPAGLRLLLCLDEYERLQSSLDAGWGTAFLDQLRHLLQHRPRIALLFTGARTFEELGPAWTDRFISARRVRVSFLRREEVIPLLTRPIPEFDMTYAPGALDALLDETAGQPFLTQAVAFELVQYLNEQGRKEATSADVEEAIACALVSGAEYFANVWFDAGERGQALLGALVRGEALADDPTARKRLRDQDVLNDAGTFAVPMVARWVRRKIEETSAG